MLDNGLIPEQYIRYRLNYVLYYVVVKLNNELF